MARFHSCFGLNFLAVVILCASCGKSSPPSTFNSTEPVTVLATVYPLADVARQVGGSHVTVSWIVEGGQSISGLVPDFDIRDRLRTAELVLSGGATEPWADAGFGDPAQHRRIVRMDALDTAAPNTPSVGLLWLDPVSVQNTCKELGQRLCLLRPKFEKEFNQQTSDFVAKIESINQEYGPKFSAAMTKKVLVLSSDFNPLLQRFGLWPIQPVTASPMQLDDAGIRALKSASAENGTHILLVPLDTPDAIARDIEVRGELQVVRIDFLGSSGGAGHNSYLNMLRFDLDQLLNATTVR